MVHSNARFGRPISRRPIEALDVNDAWIAGRMKHIDASGIRKAFDMAKVDEGPDQPLDRPARLRRRPEPVKRAAIEAIEGGFNAYTVTQGIPELRGKIQAAVDLEFRHRATARSSSPRGPRGPCSWPLCCVVDPGDEVILFDPYFVMYRHLVTLAGGTSVLIDTYPDFAIDLAKVAAAITPRTKCVLVNSPTNPTGAVASSAEMAGAGEPLPGAGHSCSSATRSIATFCFDAPFTSPARSGTPRTSWWLTASPKPHGMTGWRLGFAHGPARLLEEMAKLQQFSYVCAPEHRPEGGRGRHRPRPFGPHRSANYRKKRDAVVAALGDLYEIWPTPGGAFYAFPKGRPGGRGPSSSPRRSATRS